MSESQTSTVLDRVKPTVVRRRVIDVKPAIDPDCDEAPPSSIFLHPDYNLPLAFVDEDELDDDDDDDDDLDGEAPKSEALPPGSIRPTLEVAGNATVAAVAKRLGVPPADAVATLVARGFFAMTARAALTEEGHRALGDAYHCRLVPSLPVAKPAKPRKRAKKKR